MEAASRPPLEPLSDLPVEEPLDIPAPRKEPQAAASAPATAQPDSPSLASKSPEQTGLNFVDPEMFLATGRYPTIVPVEEPTKPPEPPPGLELELEDPVVDDMLTAPPPPPPKPVVAPTAAAPSAAKGEAAPAVGEERSSRVPIAKTASLSAAATKLAAAAGQRTVSKPAAVTPTPRPQPAKDSSARDAQAAEAPAKNGASKDAAPQQAPKDAGRDTPPAAGAAKDTVASAGPAKEVKEAKEAPSLASWASARAAASPAVKPGAPPSKSNGATAVKPVAAPPLKPAAAPATGSSAPSRTAAAKPAAAAPAVAPAPAAAAPLASAPMDRDFIARNQVVERYLSGRLPLKGATDFERFCHDHPELLDDIGLPERVNAGLRLLEAAGKPEPWQEAPRPLWQKPGVTVGLAAAAAVFGIGLAIATGTAASQSHKIAELQKQVTEQTLDPATSTRSIRLMPSRSGASNAPAIIIGGGKAELADLKIDESRSQYHVFRVTIDRIDQGRVGVITNLAKDSNGHLRIALNSSALGPGNYQLTLEGLDWHGDPQPDSWLTIGVAR